MSVLDYLLIALAIIIPGGIPLYLYWKYRARKFNEAEEKLKKSINNFTDALVEAAQEGLHEGLEETIPRVHETPTGLKYKKATDSYLSNPRYLTTILTVIVKKIGTVRLTEEDFIDITDNDYISLYVDMKTNDIVLKAHTTDPAGELTPYVAESADEDVFH